MKIIKFLFFFLFFLILISVIIIYNLNQTYNIKKIINDLEKDLNAKIVLNEEPDWVFLPKIQLNVKSKIENNLNIYSSKEINISFIQSYNFSPLNFKIDSNSFFINGLEIKSLEAYGNYIFNDKKIILKNLTGKVGDGKFFLNGNINNLKLEKINITGDIKNLHLNQILRQLNLANWERIEIKLSSNQFKFNSKKNNILQSAEASVPINGSMYFAVTEEERFGIAFLRLLIEKMPNLSNLSKSLTQIIDGFDGKPALFKGDLNIKSGLIQTDNLNVKNQNNRIDIKGSYDMIADLFDVKILFFESDNLVVEALVLGNIENPSIQIVNENIISNNKDENVDLKKVFDEGIQSLIDKLLGTNE